MGLRSAALNAARSASIAAMIAVTIHVITVQAATSSQLFGRAYDQAVDIYTLTNTHGIEVRLMSYGASIVSLKTPDRDGRMKNIVLGFETLDSYLAGVPYYGATVGRYANRIAQGRFTLDGTLYRLPVNNAPNSLHGGTRGFDKRIWRAEPMNSSTPNTLRLTYVSAAGEEGYPGELTAHVTYRLGEDDTLAIVYEATSTAPTPVNLTNHTYFNLSGDTSRSILDHTLLINADTFTPVDASLIPSGELRAVAATPFDFRTAARIGSRIEADDDQLKLGKGYDHNFVLNNPRAKLALAAVLTDPGSGRSMAVYTTQPGLQFYTGNNLNGKPSGQGSVYGYRTGLCLETQHFPDSPNHPAFPNTTLRPGQSYFEQTVLHFGALPPKSPKVRQAMRAEGLLK